MANIKTTGNYTIPKEILDLKPQGTMVKCVNGRYYVYLNTAKYNKTTGKSSSVGKTCIGKITLENGFQPNSFKSALGSISIKEFGEYFLVTALADPILSLLKDSFDIDDARNIFTQACIHYVNNVTTIKDIKQIYEESYLSFVYKDLHLSKDAITKFLHNLGSRETNRIKFQQQLIDSSSKEFLIELNSLKSDNNEYDYLTQLNEFGLSDTKQMNLINAYDINNHSLISSTLYGWDSNDDVLLDNFIDTNNFKDSLLLLDKEFYNKENIKLLIKDYKYIIPLSISNPSYKEIITQAKLENQFFYNSNYITHQILYQDTINNGTRVIIFKDIYQSSIEQAEYTKLIEEETKGYSQDHLLEITPFLGVFILQTSLSKQQYSAEDIFAKYKKTRTRDHSNEELDNYLKSEFINEEDYRVLRGLSFILLVTDLIQTTIVNKLKEYGINKNQRETIREFKTLKMSLNHKEWKIENLLNKHVELAHKLELTIPTFLKD